MSTSDAQLRATAKYDRENYQHISFKTRKGSRDRIKEAAEASGQSVNGFIKEAVSNAIMNAIGKPLEPSDDEFAKDILIRILKDELAIFYALHPKGAYREIEANLTAVIENEPALSEEFTKILSSGLSMKDKRKAIQKLEREKIEELRDVILDLSYNY
jgi:hypothetical protein